MRKSIYSLLAVAIVAATPGGSAAQSQYGDANAQPAPFNPQMGALMGMLIQPRHTKLGLRDRPKTGRSPPMRSGSSRGLRVAARAVPRWKGLPVGDLIEAAVDKSPARRRCAIKVRSRSQFDEAYARLTMAATPATRPPTIRSCDQGAGRVALSEPGVRDQAIAHRVPGLRTLVVLKAQMFDRNDNKRCGAPLDHRRRGAIASLCACHTASAEIVTLRYAQAYSALRTIFALPLFVAEREGFFVREGLDFSMLPVSGGGERLVAALHDGSADICHVQHRS